MEKFAERCSDVWRGRCRQRPQSCSHNYSSLPSSSQATEETAEEHHSKPVKQRHTCKLWCHRCWKFHVLAELDESSNINEEWDNFTKTINKAATEHLGHRRSKQHEWITTEPRDLIAKTKTIKPALRTKYRELNNQTKARSTRKKNILIGK